MAMISVVEFRTFLESETNQIQNLNRRSEREREWELIMS